MCGTKQRGLEPPLPWWRRDSWRSQSQNDGLSTFLIVENGHFV